MLSPSRGRVSTAFLAVLLALPVGALGAAALASPAAADVAAPGAPTMVSAMAGDMSATVSFMPAAGDDPSTTYSSTCTSMMMGGMMGMTGMGSGMGSPISVMGLSDGYTYTCTVTAMNSGGSMMSGMSNMFTPMAALTAPATPTMVMATAGNMMAAVSFMAGSNGNDPMTSYTATCSSSDMGAMTGSMTGMGMSIMVGGLTNGDTYSCTVTASNNEGTSSPSAPSPMFMPSTMGAMPPGAPTMVMAMPGNGMATVSFMPAAPNGASIMEYSASCMSSDGGMGGGMGGMGTAIMVGGLSNGHMYTCTVSAMNAMGWGMASAPSNMFMPNMMGGVGGAPSVPMHPAAAPGNGKAMLHWSPPASTGAGAITGYVVTPYVGLVAQPSHTFASSATSAVLSGLKNGMTYRFKIAAQNMMGSGPASVVTNAVTVGVPNAPTGVKATRTGKGSLSVAFTAPANNGAAITSYTASCTSSNGGAAKAKAGKSSPIVVSGLSAGKHYTCTVRATNSRGTGPASSASAGVTA